MKQKDTNPNRMKIHWKIIAQKKIIAKDFEVHNGIRIHEIRVIGVNM